MGFDLPQNVVSGLFLPYTVADWDPSTVRTYKVDGKNGDDSANGFDAPVKTLARLAQVLPRFGNGRKVRVLVLEGTYTDSLDCRQWGYAVTNGRLFRSTHDATFSDSTADRKTCGYATAVTGPDAGGAWTVGSSTTTTITLNGTEALTSEQAVGYRIRVTSGARAGDTVPIVAHDTATPSVIQIPTGFIGGAGTLAAAVTFMIEKPGVSVPNILTTSITSNSTNCFPVDGFNIAGFEATAASAMIIGTNIGTAGVGVAFMSAPSGGFSYLGSGMAFFTAATVYGDPDNTSPNPGMGTRHGGAVNTLVQGWIVTCTHAYQTYLAGNVFLGQVAQGNFFLASYVKAGINTTSFPLLNASPENMSIGSTAGQRLRFVGASGKITIRGKMSLTGVDISASTTIPIVASGEGWEIIANDVIGTTSGAAAIDCSATGVLKGRLISGRTTANSATGGSGDIKIQGGTFKAFTLLTTDEIIDAGGNQYVGTFGSAINRLTTTTWFNVPQVTADPASPTTGDVWYRSDTHQLCVREGAATLRSGAFT